MSRTIKDAIVANFADNLARVRSLVAVYDQIASPGAAPPTLAQTDVLRAAVVLLHASLEDLIRSSSEHLLPLAGVDVLDEIGFPTPEGRNADRIRLGALAPFRGDKVSDVIRAAVSARLQRSNYNSANEVGYALERIGVSRGVLSPDEATLEALMKRRHLIVHRADKDPTMLPGQGSALAQTLSKSTALAWIDTVDGVGGRIAASLPAIP